MPFVQIELIEGRTVEQKRDMAKEVTDAICKSLGVPAETVRIIIRDMSRENFATAGVLSVDRK
jgi:4-oxalocrotonate tautomerase